MCSKILDHGLNHGLLFSLFKFLGGKNILNKLETSGLKSRFVFCLCNISVLLDVRANLSETSPFLSAQMVLKSTFFQMFVELGIYKLVLTKKYFTTNIKT